MLAVPAVHPPRAEPARASRCALAGLLLLAAGAFAYFWSFGRFSEYDDEGFLLLTVRRLLEGRRLYDEIRVPYGPVSYLWRWLIHGVAGVPLSNDAVRWITMSLWLASALCTACFVQRLVRGRPAALGLAACAFAASFIHLRTLAREPGHPQELATALIALALAACALAGTRRLTWIALVLGVAASALLLVKVNVGAFFVAAVALAFALDLPARGAWRVVSSAIALAALATPVALMKAHLEFAWAQRFCAVATASVLGCVLAWRERSELRWRPRDALALASGAALVVAIALGFIIARGSTLRALFDSLLVDTLRFPSAFALPFLMSVAAVLAACVSALVAALHGLGSASVRDFVEARVLPWLRLGLVVALAFGLLDRTIFLSFGVPLTWVVLVAPRESPHSPDERVLRLLAVVVAVMQSLQAYPVAGSQVSTGTATAIAIAVLALSDLVVALPVTVFARPRLRALSDLALTLASIGALAGCAWSSRSRYELEEPLSFPGCRHVRVPERQAATYRWLVDNARASGGTFTSVIGSNSLYFWCEREPPTDLVISHSWELTTAAEQDRLVAALRADERSLVIDHTGLLGALPRQELAFFEYMRRECRPIGRFGGYTLLAPAQRGAVVPESCAWQIDEARAKLAGAREGERVLRIAVPRDAELAEVAEVRVFDIAGSRLMGFTGAKKPQWQARLADKSGRVLLPGAPATRIDGARDRELYLTLPVWPDPRPPRAPVVRFLDSQGERLLSLPLVTEVTGS